MNAHELDDVADDGGQEEGDPTEADDPILDAIWDRIGDGEPGRGFDDDPNADRFCIDPRGVTIIPPDRPPPPHNPSP
jgi:hypothetical protein